MATCEHTEEGQGLEGRERAVLETSPLPRRMVGVRLQERVQRHIVEKPADFAPNVQLLDDPVPLMVNQLVEVFRLLDTALPEQVIDVPKIFPDRIVQRYVDRDTQRVEQLVEVPTVVSPTLLLQLAEQNVDIPVWV